MAIPHEIGELIERFDRNADEYRSAQYNETQLRRDFIDPFFEALGWDVNNKLGYAEAYRHVIHEDAIKIGGHTKAPDYGFYVGETRKFFVEAKKPAINVKHSVEPAFQLRRYGWSAKLPLSILTNFDEFAVYDCRSLKPVNTDKASTARVMYLGYKEYAERWDEIAAIFSLDAVLKGAFDKYAEQTKSRRGTAEVDDAFLAEIESWRKTLASNIYLRNPQLTTRELNFAVGVIIDRIIFLRICEDRGIEPDEQLKKLLAGKDVYAELLGIFYRADQKYNSGLFHFETEKGRAESPDTLTPTLRIDDKVLKDIFRNIYLPVSPYEFSVLPADILGQVYEQFLGKVIHLTAHRATVEDKPEVRKAGGVYYTPSYIVAYIVRNTVGKLCEGKTPKQVDRLRILDPACGSGSFLISAYQYLLDWYRTRYVEEGAEKHLKRLTQDARGEWRLTTAEKRRILLQNIYGVDIDAQAVEVTKLSLLLKVLEGESERSLARQIRMLHERALPDLGSNIKCGNSLIGPDFYDAAETRELSDEEHYRLNVFDWEKEFAAIMKAGGFDAVIGNPPYIFTRNQGIDELQKTYFYKHYQHQSSQLNTFGIFVERCYALMRESGTLGFITPNNWLTIDTFAPLRKFVIEATGELKIVNILDRVFAAANVDTAIVLFEKGKPTDLTVAEMSNKEESFYRNVELPAIKAPTYIIQIALFKDSHSQQLLHRIENFSQPLNEFCIVSTGLKAYQIGKGKPFQTEFEKGNRIFHATTKIDNTYGRYLEGVDVRRYRLGWSGEFLSYGDWLAEPRKSVPFAGERLLVRQIPSKPPYLVNAIYTDEPFYNDINSMIIFSPKEKISLKYLLGLINSRLLSFWFMRTFDKLQRKIFPQFKVKELASFPIHPINFSDSTDKTRHDRMVEMVEQMLTLHKQLVAARTDHDRTIIQRRIDATDARIDALCYELYGLTDEEIKIVEEATSR